MKDLLCYYKYANGFATFNCHEFQQIFEWNSSEMVMPIDNNNNNNNINTKNIVCSACHVWRTEYNNFIGTTFFLNNNSNIQKI